MQVAQVAAGRVGCRYRLQDQLGIAQGWFLIEVAAHLRRLEPPAAGMARVLQDREAELDLGVGKGRRGAIGEVRGRQFERLGREPPVVGLGYLCHGVACAGRVAVRRDPDGRRPLAVERHRRGAVRRRNAAELRCPEQLAHLGHQRIEFHHRRGRRSLRSRRDRRRLGGRRDRRRLGGRRGGIRLRGRRGGIRLRLGSRLLLLHVRRGRHSRELRLAARCALGGCRRGADDSQDGGEADAGGQR